jgi:triacylglycerol lipase
VNIVLVHGVLGFRERFGVEYFRGVAEHFRAKGLSVLVPELDPTQGIEFRGNQLCDQLNAGFTNGSLQAQEKTHIFAHSMGGLDSRYLLSPVSAKQVRNPVLYASLVSKVMMRYKPSALAATLGLMPVWLGASYGLLLTWAR